MKFTILPDFEANRKRRAIRRQKRGQRRDARQSRKPLLFADNTIPLRERAGDEKSAWLPRYPSLYIL